MKHIHLYESFISRLINPEKYEKYRLKKAKEIVDILTDNIDYLKKLTGMNVIIENDSRFLSIYVHFYATGKRRTKLISEYKKKEEKYSDFVPCVGSYRIPDIEYIINDIVKGKRNPEFHDDIEINI